MKYGFTRTTDLGYDEAVTRVTERLAEQGFGVLTRIDAKATFKEKLGIDFKKYVILGACNPHFANKVLSEDPRIGLLLPCNVIVYEEDDGKTGVAAFNPDVMVDLIDNPKVTEVAREVRERLEQVIAGM